MDTEVLLKHFGLTMKSPNRRGYILGFLYDVHVELTYMPSPWERVFKAIEKCRQKPLSIDDCEYPKAVESIKSRITIAQLEEHIEKSTVSIAYAPSPGIAEKILLASSNREKRRILLENEEGVIATCAEIVSDLEGSLSFPESPFVNESIELMKRQSYGGAQALLTNVLDSVLTRLFERGVRRKITTKSGNEWLVGQKALIGCPDFELVFGALHNAHQVFRADRGDQVPVLYNRHASVHRVTEAQYNPTNALEALLILTNTLYFLAFKTKEVRDFERAVAVFFGAESPAQGANLEPF